MAIQLIDQSPIAFDDVVFRDLVADHAAQTDKQCLSGTGLNGQVLGVRLTPNIGTVAATAVDIQGVYSAIANAVQTVHTTRFLPPEVIVMHPRRWGWFLSLLDGQQRPLFLPTPTRRWNVAGVLTDVASQQVVGQMHGLPVVTDPNIETTLGTGGNEDPVYVLRASDVVLWESGIKARSTAGDQGADLTVLLQLYSYLAFSAARYPQSVVEITGLTAPTWRRSHSVREILRTVWGLSHANHPERETALGAMRGASHPLDGPAPTLRFRSDSQLFQQ